MRGAVSPKAQSASSNVTRARAALEPDAVRALLGTPRAVELMRALGLVTERGGASPDSHRKLKQIKHFIRLISPALEDAVVRHEEPRFVDAAAGKGYLGLLLSELTLRGEGRGRLDAIEARPELVARVRSIAEEMELPVTVHEGTIIDAPWPERAHFVMALHACDTATDEAIVRAVAARADHIALVPCCQAEVGRLLGSVDRERAVAPLWGTAWHRREFGAHLTNVIRVLALRSRGYQVTVTELAGWEHSLKNELILARRVARFHEGARRELEALLAEIPVAPWLLGALEAIGDEEVGDD